MQERRFYVVGFLESDYDGGYDGSPCHVTCKWILKVARTDSGSIPIWYLIDCEFKNTSAKACVSKTFLYTALKGRSSTGFFALKREGEMMMLRRAAL
jgi:hypothetical protein